jgi:molybdenum cofactor cytidylyltransferase
VLVRKLGIAILAAGAGQRLGGKKQSTIFEGETLLARAVRTALESKVGRVNVVLGYDVEKFIPVLPKDVSISINQNWQEGIASSIRLAVESAISCECDGILFTTCDQPFVDSNLLISLAHEFEKTSKLVVASFYGTPGIPAIFSKEKFAELLLLNGDKGAKRIILDSDPHLIAAPQAQYDIDTEADLETCKLTDPKENSQWPTKNALAKTTVTKEKQTFPDEAFSKEPA